jgi:hypothetical protein
MKGDVFKLSQFEVQNISGAHPFKCHECHRHFSGKFWHLKCQKCNGAYCCLPCRGNYWKHEDHGVDVLEPEPLSGNFLSMFITLHKPIGLKYF